MYKFRREDDGAIVEVDFETHMGQDRGGYVTLPDGVRARRVNDFQTQKAATEKGNANQTPPPSDSLGFTVHQLNEFEEDRVRNGFVGVEFKPDPRCPEFLQVHFSGPQAREDYIRHRQMVDKGSSTGVFISEQNLHDARKFAKSIKTQK